MLIGRKFLFKYLANLMTPTRHDYNLWERKNRLLRKTGIAIGKNVAINENFFVLKNYEQNLEIGDYVTMGEFVQIWPFNKIKIGKFTTFAGGVTLVNGGHDTETYEPHSSELVIGSGCWFGNGVKIVKGVNIGNNVIVGAGSVVVSDMPDNSIVVGVPGKVIRYRTLPDKVWHLGSEYFCPKKFQLHEN